MKKWFLVAAGILSILIGFFASSRMNRSDFSFISDYSFDKNGNLYILNLHNQYSADIKRLSPSGTVIYDSDLPSEENGLINRYEQIEADDKGNIIVMVFGMLKQGDGENAEYKVKKERLLLYNSYGKYEKELAKFEHSDDDLRTTPYIFKFQIIGGIIDFFCCRDKVWNQFKIDINNPAESTPTSVQSFKLVDEPNSTGNSDWLNSYSIASTLDNRIIYSTKTGKCYAMDTNKSFNDITLRIGDYVSTTNITVDPNNNFYFMNLETGNMYSYSMNNENLIQLFQNDSYIAKNKDKNIRLSDVYDVALINDNSKQLFSCVNKDGDLYVRFGNTGDTSNTINKITNPFFPNIFLTAVVISIGAFLGLSALLFLVFLARKRSPLIFKIYVSFLPVFVGFIVLIAVVSYILIYEDYREMKLSSQLNSANLLAESIDGDVLQTFYLDVYNSTEYNNMVENINKTLDHVKKQTPKTVDYINTYIIRNDKIYTFLRVEKDDILYPARSYEGAMSADTISVVFSQSNTDDRPDLYDLLLEMEGQISRGYIKPPLFNNHLNVYAREVKDAGGEWISVVCPVKNTKGEIVGLVETLINYEQYKEVFRSTAFFIMIALSIVTLLIFFYLFFVLKFTFKPLKRLQKSVSAIGDGLWDVKVRVTTHDEIGDVGTAFNLMSDRINQYVSSIAVLNKICLKFLPKDLFGLMGKDRITDIKLYDEVQKECHLLLISFYYSESEKALEDTSQKDYFNKFNYDFNNIYKIVNKNYGIIDYYDGRGMLIIFPREASDALNTSLELIDKFSIKDGEYCSVRTVLSTGDMLIGVAGNEARCAVVVLSDMILASQYIISQMEKLGVKYVIEKGIMEHLSGVKNLNYRYLGKVRYSLKNDCVHIYEMIDNKNVHEKNLYISSKKIFEYGVNCYINGDFYNARRAFSNVLSINEDDQVAMYYMTLCNENSNVNHDKWEGFLF